MIMKTGLTETELRAEYEKFNEQEKSDYEEIFNYREAMNSNDPASSHIEAVDAVVYLRNKK